jgi:hypothetical protein
VIAVALLTTMYVVTVHRADEEAVQHSASNSVTQSQPGGTQDAPGGIPRPGGA